MVNKTIFLLLVTFFITIFSVVAQPPVTTVDFTDNGIFVRDAGQEYFRYGDDIHIDFHLYNQSNGLVLTNSTTSCSFELYNHTGQHIYTKSPITNNDAFGGFEVYVAKNNLTYFGEYSYSMQCNSSTIAGSTQRMIYVTKDGYEPKYDKDIFAYSLVFLLILIIILSWSITQVQSYWKLVPALIIPILVLIMLNVLILMYSGIGNISTLTSLIEGLYIIILYLYLGFIFLALWIMITHIRTPTKRDIPKSPLEIAREKRRIRQGKEV